MSRQYRQDPPGSRSEGRDYHDYEFEDGRSIPRTVRGRPPPEDHEDYEHGRPIPRTERSRPPAEDQEVYHNYEDDRPVFHADFDTNQEAFSPYGEIRPTRTSSTTSSPTGVDSFTNDGDAIETRTFVAIDIDDHVVKPPAQLGQTRKSDALRPRKSSRRIIEKRKREKRSKKSEKKQYTPDLPEPKREEDTSCAARYWQPFSRFCTLLIPDCLICLNGKAAKQAWREKITIFGIMIFLNLVFLGLFGVIPLYFCREEKTVLSDYEWYNTAIGPTCLTLNYIMYGILFFAAGILALQCFCSLWIGMQSFIRRVRNARKNEEDSQDSAVLVMVPCYNEGEHELRKTIKSILNTDYPEEDKVMMVIADGIITGKGEWMNTPVTLSKILGFKVDKKDPAYAYKSIGAAGENRASVYSGVYKAGGKSLKYVVIVKRGLPSEKDSSRPGNRGKRDSQLIAMGMFNRIHHDRKLQELDRAVCSALNDLQVPSTEIEYLLAIDADTRISDASISHMVDYMERKEHVLACCGETKIDNKTQSWVTMIQIFEYFASHNLKKAFESVFGCVTCLPGCFTMYRMFCPDDMRPLLSADKVFQSYSRNDIDSLHEKNLYALGEDRMLTTLLLEIFHEMSLSYVPVAACWTIVPDTFMVLLSQRRRWINSTFHNMWELLKVNTLCGICCLSMKAVVLLDMISTMILPAAVLYAFSFIYIVFVEGEKMSQMTLILYGVIFGVQVLIFLVRSRIDYILWFLIYIVLGIPVFYFILPLYSFWHMDDLSWGTTRQVADKKPSETGGAKK